MTEIRVTTLRPLTWENSANNIDGIYGAPDDPFKTDLGHLLPRDQTLMSTCDKGLSTDPTQVGLTCNTLLGNNMTSTLLARSEDRPCDPLRTFSSSLSDPTKPPLSGEKARPEDVLTLPCPEDVLTLLRPEDVLTLLRPEDVRTLSCSESDFTEDIVGDVVSDPPVGVPPSLGLPLPLKDVPGLEELDSFAGPPPLVLIPLSGY